MAKKRRKVFRRQADRSWKELKPRKRGPGRPPKKKLSPYMKRKAERERAERDAFNDRMRKSDIEPLDHERRRLATAGWTQDLSWQSKPPPPEFIYMIIGGKPIKCRLMTMHNMPVYLPDIDELP